MVRREEISNVFRFSDLPPTLHQRLTIQPDFQVAKQELRRRPGVPGRPQTVYLLLFLAILVFGGRADGSEKPELPQPEQTELLITPSAIGDIEYRPGRGLKIGDSGFTLGGFSTLTADRAEGDRGRFRFDDLDLFLFFDPTPYVHVFSDVTFEKLVEIDDSGGQRSSAASASVDRLYGDLNLNDHVNFRLGKFLTPVGRWNQVPAEPLVWTTSRPLVTNRPFDEHVTGAAFWGSVFPLGGALTYTLYGQFLEALTPSSNKPPADKSAGARADFSTLKGWSVGSSYFAFSRNGRWEHLSGVDGLWRHDRLELSGEFLAGHGDPYGRRIVGLYLQGVVRLVTHLYAVGRYEYFDSGPHEPGLDLYDLGVAWRPISFLILKVDYLVASRHSQLANPGIYGSIALLF